jgi:hypothetical protein
MKDENMKTKAKVLRHLNENGYIQDVSGYYSKEPLKGLKVRLLLGDDSVKLEVEAGWETSTEVMPYGTLGWCGACIGETLQCSIQDLVIKMVLRLV